MDFDITRQQWIDRFAARMADGIVGAEPDSFIAIAEALYATRGQIDPAQAADAEVLARQRIADPIEGGSGDRFERTERIPVERIEAGGEYVRDDSEWIARCVNRVLALDPIIKAEEARRSIADLAALERWRVMLPEAAAEQLYTPIKPRHA